MDSVNKVRPSKTASRRYWPKLVLGPVVTTILLGCSDSGPRVVPVSGRATRAGKALTDLTISFIPQSGGRPSQAKLDDQGRFNLVYGLDKDGAEVGTHVVSVSYAPKDPGEEMALVEGTKKHPPAVAEILHKYGDPATSTLKVDINDPTSDLEVKFD